MYICTPHACLGPEEVVRLHSGAGNRTWVLYKNSQCSYWQPPLQGLEEGLSEGWIRSGVLAWKSYPECGRYGLRAAVLTLDVCERENGE